MQCKDIPDLPILEFIGSFNGAWCQLSGTEYPQSVFRAMPEGVPWKLGKAKMHMLIRRGLVEGCTCGCRGDFYLTKKGKSFIAESLPDLASDGQESLD